MKKVFFVIAILMVFSATVILIGCKSSNQSAQNQTNQSTTQNTAPQANNSNQVFSSEDLAKYTGQNGSKAYVAVNGIVYDVTNAPRWRNGRHEEGIVAGVDLTSAILRSPHGTSVLDRIPQVGTLK